MKGITLDKLGARPAPRADLPDPIPGPGDILVRVHASSINPVDNAIAAGMLKDMVEHEFPITLGRDYAGVVEQLGADISSFEVGDEVFGFIGAMNPTIHAGTWTELIVVPETMSIAHKPQAVDFATAGASPLAGITAMSAIDVLGLNPGDTLLVIGATGGVGSIAVQLAAHAGATVIAAALTEDEPYLRELGMAEIVPRDAEVAAAVRGRYPDGVDALLDNVSYAPGAYDAALKDGARVASPNNAAGQGPGRTNLMAAPTSENLERLANLLDSGIVKVPIHETYAFAQAPAAMSALATTHTQGKLALQIAE
jgi:NADPH:quinone reductase-like Zn-dependent oxidoreductase